MKHLTHLFIMAASLFTLIALGSGCATGTSSAPCPTDDPTMSPATFDDLLSSQCELYVTCDVSDPTSDAFETCVQDYREDWSVSLLPLADTAPDCFDATVSYLTCLNEAQLGTEGAYCELSYSDAVATTCLDRLADKHAACNTAPEVTLDDAVSAMCSAQIACDPENLPPPGDFATCVDYMTAEWGETFIDDGTISSGCRTAYLEYYVCMGQAVADDCSLVENAEMICPDLLMAIQTECSNG